MIATIQPGRAAGTVAAPASKSMAHRLLICAGLCSGKSQIRGVEMNEDVLATMDCLRALGVNCRVEGNVVTVEGTDLQKAKPADTLRCRESGSTLRFFIPLALLGDMLVALTGTKKLLSRPLQVYADLCARQKLTFSQTEDFVQVQGRLQSGTFQVPGHISSQFITGLLLALPLLPGDSRICIAPPVESCGYIELTLQAMAMFGVKATWEDEFTLVIPGNQTYQAADLAVEGDYSGAAFYGALNALGGRITVTGLLPESLQADKVYLAHFESLCQGKPMIHIADCPDLGPVLFAVAAAKHGGIFTGTRRLKIKESDRAQAMAEELAAFGIQVTVMEDKVHVHPGTLHRPDRICDGHNDHRIVMSLAVLMTLTGGQIRGAQAVRKSFPDFFDRIRELGIEVSLQEVDQ